MHNEKRFLPVSVSVGSDTVYENIKKTRKVKNGWFLLVFALYLLSTLLGAALVPGRLCLSHDIYLFYTTSNSVSILFEERCFFALFYLFCGFTLLKIPCCLLFVVSSGLHIGILARLSIQYQKPFTYALLALLFALTIIIDVFISVVPIYIKPFQVNALQINNTLLYILSFVLYLTVTFFISFLTTVVIK